VLAGLACCLSACGSHPAPPATNVVAPGQLLRRPPDLGVACPRANSLRCDRVGLAVWLEHPAARVSATVDGRPLRLTVAHWSTQRPPWLGYLHPAGLLDGALRVTPDSGRYGWQGRHPKRARLVIDVTGRDGSKARTRLSVPLLAGWG
jgi:hypothetical protein